MALNLAQKFATKDQATLQLRDPSTDENLFDDEGNPVEIVMYGKTSRQYRNAFQAMQDRHINRGKKKMSAALYLQEAIDLLVACSVTANNLELDGNPVDNPKAFEALYSNPDFEWVKDQCDQFLGDISSFLQKPATT